MVPPDENALLELRAGSLLPTVHFKLPFSTADGKQIIIALPGDCIPCYARSEIGTNSDEGINFNFYDLYRLERPTDPQQRIAYVPFTPIYTPRHGGSDRPAILVDQHSGWVSTSNGVDER